MNVLKTFAILVQNNDILYYLKIIVKLNLKRLK